MIVPDASVVALLFGDSKDDFRRPHATAQLRKDPVWLVPEHWRTEVFSAIRGLVRGGKLDTERAARAVGWLRQVTVITSPTGPVLPRMWELRNNVSAYDAGYVAVAEAHDVTLVTADARIARAGVARCPILVVS